MAINVVRPIMSAIIGAERYGDLVKWWDSDPYADYFLGAFQLALLTIVVGSYLKLQLEYIMMVVGPVLILGLERATAYASHDE